MGYRGRTVKQAKYGPGQKLTQEACRVENPADGRPPTVAVATVVSARGTRRPSPRAHRADGVSDQ